MRIDLEFGILSVKLSLKQLYTRNYYIYIYIIYYTLILFLSFVTITIHTNSNII